MAKAARKTKATPVSMGDSIDDVLLGDFAINDAETISDGMLKSKEPEPSMQTPYIPDAFLSELPESEVREEKEKPQPKVKHVEAEKEKAKIVDDTQFTGEITEVFDARSAIEKLILDRQRVVTIRPIKRGGRKLGLANQPENYQAMPGTLLRWAPSKKGNKYLTGLKRLSPQKIKELEDEIGFDLDNEYYANMTFPLDRNRITGEKLDLSKADQYLIYLAMLESPLIAATQNESKNGKKPFAEFYFEDLEAEALADAQEIKEKDRARDYVKKASEASKRALLKALGESTFNLSDLAVSTKLRKYLEDVPAESLRKARLINAVLDKGDTYLQVAAMFKDGTAMNIIRRTPTKDFAYGEYILGPTEESAIEYLIDPQHSAVRLAIKGRIDIELGRK